MLDPVYDDEEAPAKPRKRPSPLPMVAVVGLAVVILCGLLVIASTLGPEAVIRLGAIASVILAPAVLAGLAGKSRTIGARGGFYLGLLLSVLGVLIVLVIPVKEQRAPKTATKECPYCAERVQLRARVCRYCDRDIA